MNRRFALLVVGLAVIAAGPAVGTGTASASNAASVRAAAPALVPAGGTPLADQFTSTGGPIPGVLPGPGGGGGGAGGNTHCFVSWDHAGCQLDHSASLDVVNEVIAGSAGVAVGLICDAVTEGSATIGCVWIASAVFYGIQGHITVMPYGDCLEVGEYYWGTTYAKLISCSIE